MTPASEGGVSPQVSFIIPAYQSRRTIAFTLRSILEQQSPATAETVVVDSSEESLADWLRSWFPGVRIIHSPHRLTPGAARNLGVRHCRGEFLAFLDADTAAQPNWMATMLTTAQARPQAGLAGGWIGNANPQSQASRVLHWTEFSEFLPGLPGRPVKFLSSANLFLRRRSFEDAGGFPEALPASEDRLFCDRVSGEHYFESATGVLHYHRSQWGRVLLHLRHLGYWGGRVRAEGVGPGSSLKRFPAASLLLGPYRTVLVLARVLRASPKKAPVSLLHLPLIAMACQAWAIGFAAGLRGRPSGPG